MPRKLTKRDAQRAILAGILIGIGAYIALIWLSTISNSQLVGFSGSYQDGAFVVSRVSPGSPAEQTGIRAGDRILRQGGTPVAELYADFNSDLQSYLNRRNGWRYTETDFLLERDGRALRVTLTPRPLSFLETVRFYGIRVVLVAILIALVLFVAISRPKDPSAFPISLCFCLTAFWLVTDSTYTPFFFSSLIVDRSFTEFLLKESLALAALQLILSMILHIALVFPRRRGILERHRWVLAAIYVLPLSVLATFLVGGGNLTERLNSVYAQRLWLDSFILALFVLLVVDNHRTVESPTQREQTKWVLAAVIVVAVCQLALWNVPRLLIDRPLVPDFDWVIVSILLVPLTFTIGIVNYELLGVRGIIRRRIRVLEKRVLKEKTWTARKDERIQSLTDEIEQLRAELAEFAAQERPQADRAREFSGLGHLESQHPKLKRIRETRLIGVSPSWERVFEDAVLAARGVAPVLIFGESGTGKTDLAWTVFQLSERSDRPYKAVSCAQFEHTDPAFSLGRLFGIGTDHGLPNVRKEGQKGLLEDCDGGTLFLDDFDRLPLVIQDLFLYPFEGKPFEPGIGAGSPKTVSIKFILAVNRDPDTLIGDGILRADVLARVGTRIDLPPLRERPEDIPLLVEHYLRELSNELRHEISLVSPKAATLLASYTYPQGNVRELKAEIRRATGRAMLGDDHVLRAGYLSERLQLHAAAARVPPKTAQRSRRSPLANDDWGESRKERTCEWDSAELAVLRRHKFHLKSAERELGFSHKSRTLSNHLRGMCIRALVENDGRVELAALSLAGTQDSSIVVKLETKIRRFAESVKDHVERGAEQKLFNNLPAGYHEALRKAIQWTHARLVSKPSVDAQ